ncbi:MAG: four helix bundle protein [Planctomycetes bacterium]|nr:four helix bundle protein [Planctomycetota bacterium]
MSPEELKHRTKLFGLRVIKLVAALPRSIIGQEIGRQLLKAGTSVGANYRAACRARSRAEFIAKIGVVVEEADESAYWVELIVAAGIMPLRRVASLLQEANELVAIMSSSRVTASAHRPPRRAASFNRQSAIGNRQ